LENEGNEERSGKEKCALCRAEEWTEMKRWREKLLNSKWLNINGEIVYKRVSNCTQIMKQRNLGTCTF